MAKSLDDLVDFLLDEIALDSGRGASLKDVVQYTRNFYAQPYDNATTPPATIAPHPTTTHIDKNFIRQLWKWLTTQNDLRIGRDDEYRNSRLDQIEDEFPDLLTGVFNSPEDGNLSISNLASVGNNGSSKSVNPRRKDPGPRIYANQDRIYHAVCGHESDPSRVSELEFALLCTIGAARHDGILQGELGRLAKQDKRSVPKRTDALQAKGYVEKHSVYIGGHKTSRILLHRFADSQTISHAISSSPRLGDLARQILTVMRENPFTTQEDLASRLSIFDPLKLQVLNQVVQYLTRKGCLKKVKTAFAPDSASTDLRPSLQYIQSLEVSDYEDTDDSVISLNTSLDAAIALVKEGVNEEDEDKDVTEIDFEATSSELLNSQISTRPSWNPDRVLPNVVYDLATLRGDDGLTNLAVRQQITGISVRRPVEALLVRLSHAALKAQPSVDRDLALVRTTEVKDGVHRFVHRSLNTYHEMVTRGDLTWTATNGGSTYAKHLHTESVKAVDASDIDVFGFMKSSKSDRHMNATRTTIEDIAGVPGPDAAVFVRPGEATIVTDEAGLRTLSTKPESANHKSPPRSKTPRRPSFIVTFKIGEGLATEQNTSEIWYDSTPTKPKVKPGTFPRGTRQFWEHVFRVRKLEVDPESAHVKQAVLMNDPDCLQIFAERPKEFDSLLVRALRQGCPVPHNPIGINKTWVSRAKAFLDRTHSGVYCMPSGLVDLQQQKWACIVIVRSDRLRGLDMTNQVHPISVLFLTSSAAHTFRVHRVSQRQPPDWEQLGADATSLAHAGRHSRRSPLAPGMTRDLLTGDVSHSPLYPTSPSRQSLIITLVLPKSDSRPLSSVDQQKKGYDTYPSRKRPVSQEQRTRRPRRPTRKALESTQTIISEASTPETSSSSAATPEDLFSTQDNIRYSTSLPSNDEPVLTGISGSSIEPNAPDINRALQMGTTHKSAPTLPQNGVKDRDTPQMDKVEDLQANEKVVLEHVQMLAVHAESVQAESPSQTEADLVSTAVLSFEAESDNHLTRSDATPGTNLDTIHSDALGNADSERLLVDPSESSIPLSRKATPTVDPSQLKFLTGKDASPYYKKFLIELVYMCGGVVPNDPSLLKRAMGPKSVEAHVEANMNIKIIKTSIAALTQSGKLKVMQFAFQKNGFNHTKAILALPSTQPTDQLFIAMQTKISLLPANIDYVPPELEIEATRKPQGILRTVDTPAPETKVKSKPATPVRPKRQKKQQGPGEGGSCVDPTVERLSLEVSLNTSFLTLKVPRIAEVKTDQLFTSKYFDLPAQPVIIDTDHNGRGVETPSLRRSSVRNSQRFNTATRKVQWRTPKYTALPKSLRAILANDLRVNEIDHALSINPSLENFDRDIDFVATWEQKNFNDLQEPRPREWNFINHLSFRKEFVDTRGEGDLQFRVVTFDELLGEVEKVLPEPKSWAVFADILSKEAKKSRKANNNKLKRKRVNEDHMPVAETDDDDDDDGQSDFMSSDEGPPKKKRQRGPNHKWRRKPRIAGTELDRRRQKRTFVKPRGVGLRDIPKEWAHRITTAIVVVRVLAGGLDKYLDWKLVARLIPGEPESVLQSRWRTISTRYNNDFDAMVHDIQAKYLDALADDQVPSVNYNDLPSTNWEGIFEWAIVNINADNKGVTVIELPPNREEFLELVSAEVGEVTSVRPLHNNSLQYTQATKEDFWCSMIPGTVPDFLPAAQTKALEPVFQTEEDEADLQLARARSWVFAAVMTPHEAFDAKLTHEKLRKLAVNDKECEELIETTIKKLQNDKMVVTKDSTDAVIQAEGNTLSGTYHWKLSTKFVDRFELNRHVTSNMLRQAVQYKLEVLDPTFARCEVITIPGDPYVADGVMVAIFNLMNAGMISLEPGADMTANRYGVDGGSEGYKTRSMDKRHLLFSVILRPTSSYIPGDLAIIEKRRVTIPRGDIDQEDGMGLIPIWFDINHTFRPDIWDMIVGATTGLISCRPGVSSLELVRTLQYAVSQKDMVMIVNYLFECKFIQKTRSGWETTENWWFVIGTGTVGRLGVGMAMGTENGMGGSMSM